MFFNIPKEIFKEILLYVSPTTKLFTVYELVNKEWKCAINILFIKIQKKCELSECIKMNHFKLLKYLIKKQKLTFNKHFNNSKTCYIFSDFLQSYPCSLGILNNRIKILKWICQEKDYKIHAITFIIAISDNKNDFLQWIQNYTNEYDSIIQLLKYCYEYIDVLKYFRELYKHKGEIVNSQRINKDLKELYKFIEMTKISDKTANNLGRLNRKI